jgi:hypothetical protein
MNIVIIAWAVMVRVGNCPSMATFSVWRLQTAGQQHS